MVSSLFGRFFSTRSRNTLSNFAPLQTQKGAAFEAIIRCRPESRFAVKRDRAIHAEAQARI